MVRIIWVRIWVGGDGGGDYHPPLGCFNEKIEKYGYYLLKIYS